MESIFIYICEHAHHAHWFLFALLLISGFGIPISEDLVLISAGAIASSCIPDHTFSLYLSVLLGCYLAAWEVYWIGRLLGPKLYRFRLFNHTVTPHRRNLVKHFYAKWGFFTFIIGRFCPGGVRNVLFLTSGFTKMPFHLFILRDGIAVIISSAVFFSLGYMIGLHIENIQHYLKEYTIGFILLLIIAFSIGYFYYKKLN